MDSKVIKKVENAEEMKKQIISTFIGQWPDTRNDSGSFPHATFSRFQRAQRERIED